MKFLIDTNVLSEARHPNGDAQVKTWVTQLPSASAFVSAITFGEIAMGAAKLPVGARQRAFRQWLQQLRVAFDTRIVPVDADVAEAWGEAEALGRARGRTVPTADGLIAATARVRGLHVATRNVRHMLDTGVAAFDPWTGQTHTPIP